MEPHARQLYGGRAILLSSLGAVSGVKLVDNITVNYLLVGLSSVVFLMSEFPIEVLLTIRSGSELRVAEGVSRAGKGLARATGGGARATGAGARARMCMWDQVVSVQGTVGRSTKNRKRRVNVRVVAESLRARAGGGRMHGPDAHSMGIAGSDCIQYFAGKLFGRTKIVPKISPNKSLEGYLAGVALCNAIYFGWLADYSVVSFTQGAVYVNGMLIAGILGDLFISWWKRNHHIKDTSTLLLAHGGFLDRCVFFFFFGCPSAAWAR